MNTMHRISLLSVALAAALSISNVQAAARSWSYTYNSMGLVETADGPRTDVSDITTYDYDPQGRLSQVTNALGHITQLSNFDSYGNPQTILDANGVTTTLGYTPQGWLASVSTAGSTTIITHDNVGQIKRVTRGDGSWLEYTWDNARRLATITNNQGEKVEYDYDAMGNRKAQRLKNASAITTQQHSWVYDELGRLMRSVGAENQAQTYGYDLNDNVTLSTNPKQKSTTLGYDALNRLISNTDPLSGVTGLAYDGQDNRTEVTDPRNVTTEYKFDGLGNLTQLISPDSGTTIFTHDAAGNILSKTDARNVVTNYTYDALNRLTHREYPASPALNVQYHYDMTTNGNKGIGRLTAVEDASGVLGYRYDARGNLVEQVRSLSINGTATNDILEYGYDNADQLSRIGYPAGFAVQYQRNTAGQVSAVDIVIGTEAPASFASSISYMPFGPLKNLTWANGITLSRTYDLDYRLGQQSVGPWQATYGYDANSNIETLQNGIFGDLNYSYDDLDRLVTEAEVTQIQEYDYDAAGNRIEKTVTPVVDGQPQASTNISLTYASNSNRLTELDGQPVISDAAGNLTQDRASRELEYDLQGRLDKVKISGNVVADYHYNALGQRTQKITDTAIFTFLYGPDGQLLGESRYSLGGVKLSSQYYLWLDSMPLGGITLNFDAAGAITSSTAFYLHSDHLNTPRLATNQAQQEVWRWESDAFGNGVATNAPGSGLSAINLRFPGQYYDSESGLHYNYFRDYDPQTGRYVESDPIGLAYDMYDPSLKIADKLGLVSPVDESTALLNQLYVYTTNNPINFYDISGLAKDKYEKPENPNKRKGADERRPTGERERNVGHPEGEEHSRRPKGGIRFKLPIPLMIDPCLIDPTLCNPAWPYDLPTSC